MSKYIATSSGRLNANTQVVAGGVNGIGVGGLLHYAKAEAGATVTIHNGTSTSDPVVWAGTANQESTFDTPVVCSNGIYVAVSGGNAFIHYSLA